jgi:hypothetical protein
MISFMIFATAVGGACWVFKQWLAYQERQQLLGRMERMERENGQPLDRETLQRWQGAAAEMFKPTGDGGMSIGMKCLIALAAAIYIICPFDFDFIPVLGWVDDAAVGYYAYKAIRRN